MNMTYIVRVRYLERIISPSDMQKLGDLEAHQQAKRADGVLEQFFLFISKQATLPSPVALVECFFFPYSSSRLNYAGACSY